MINDVLTQLIDFIKNASSFLWETLVRQVYVNVFGMFIGAAACVAVSILLFFVGKRVAHNDEYDDFGPAMIWFFSVIMALAGIGLATAAGMHLMNPSYYAIQMIIEQLK